MVTTAKQRSDRRNLKSFRDGRDEMNLVEFPFATLSERSGSTKVLEFQVDDYDRIAGKPVSRKLTVTGDAKYGLPTAKDEEVYLGLLQLTKVHNDFGDPKVYFTRGELIRLMGWKNRDWSYHRVATALCRLTGVRLFYENAWRDNTKKRFRSQGGFGLLDSFEIRDGRVRASNGDETERLSEFRWNSVIFESFQSGYLKKLDYSKVRELGTIARRVYRYLDKHFHPPHRTTLTPNLKVFAFEHIGVSRKNDSAQIRRTLDKPIEELVKHGFLAPDENRFRKIAGRRGEWEVVFSMAGHLPNSTTKRNRRAGAKKAQPNRSIPTESIRQTSHAGSNRIDSYINNLSNSEMKKLETQAIQSASGFLLETLENNQCGPLAEECRRQIVRAFLTQKLKK